MRTTGQALIDELVDPGIPDTFVEGIGAISLTSGGCVRFTLFQTRQRGNERERVIVAQLVWPKALIEFAIEQSRIFIETGECLVSEMPKGIVPN